MSIIKSSTDYQYLRRSVKNKIKAFIEANQGQQPTNNDLNGFFKDSFQELKKDLKVCGIDPLERRKLKSEIENEFITQTVTLTGNIDDDSEDNDIEED